MKNTANQLIQSAIFDNEEYINDHHNGNAEEYFLQTWEMAPEHFYCWMTDEEIEKFENNENRKEIDLQFRQLLKDNCQ